MPFAETYAAMKAERVRLFELQDEYNAGLRRDQEDLFRQRFPKKKKIDLDVLKDDDASKAIYDRWKAKAAAIMEWHKNAETEFEERLDKEAASEEIPKTKFLGLVETIYSSSYSTQGFGASRYAKGSAEQKADLARHQGFEVDVLMVKSEYLKGPMHGMSYEDYGVFVNTTTIGWEMIRRRKGPGLKELLRMCWKRGVNPRVYYPMLPYNLEEKFGIDYFGNDVIK